jgi:hypothetical protein
MGKALDRNVTMGHEFKHTNLAPLTSVCICVHLCLLFFLRPTRREFVGHSQMIENPGDHGVHDIRNAFRAGVETGIRRQNGRAGEQQQFEILHMDEAQRSFARDENQFFLFLQHDIRCALQDVLAVTVGDAAKRAHRAGNDHHGIGGVGAAGERRIHAFEVVRFRPGGQAQAAR